MVGSLGFPKGLIAVEALVGKSRRRADIVCYALMPHLSPLLVVECKALAFSADAEAQAFGYNRTFGAPFICLATGEELTTLWYSSGRVCRVSDLPSFKELYDAAKTILS